GAGGLASEMLIWGPLARGQSGAARPAPVGSALLAGGESGAQPAGAAVAAPSQTWPEKDRSAGTAPAPGLQPGTGETTVLPQAVSALRGDNAQAVPGRTWTLPQAPLRTAMLAALVGASSLFVLFAGSLGGSGTLSGL